MSFSPTGEKDQTAASPKKNRSSNPLWKYLKKISPFNDNKKGNDEKKNEILFSMRVSCNVSGGVFAYHHVTVYKLDEQSRLVQINKFVYDKSGGMLKSDSIVSTYKITSQHIIKEVTGNDLNNFAFKPKPKFAIQIVEENITFLFFHEPDKIKLAYALAIIKNSNNNILNDNTENATSNADGIGQSKKDLQNDDVMQSTNNKLALEQQPLKSTSSFLELKSITEESIDKPVVKQELSNSLIFILLSLGVSLLKLLLSFPLYHSTDLEVHRNWMAITHHLPLRQWYHDKTSIWTLDYPPYFAYFEKILSYFAYYYDESILVLRAEPFASSSALMYLRLSVIFSDFVLLYATYSYVSHAYSHSNNKAIVSYVLTVFNAALLLVDHIHFQYNGLLVGVLILCIDSGNRKQYLRMAMYYSILVLMKHLFVYIAPVIGFYLIMQYCDGGRNVARFFILGTIAIVNLFLAFAPFILLPDSCVLDFSMMQQIFQRLFPFGRGLLHAYWAPNMWAIYYFIDKVISVVMKNNNNKTTSGIIGEYPTLYLATITPLTTLVLNVLFIVPSLCYLYSCSNQPNSLMKMVLYCSFTSFLFGYHVHEKAILVPLILLGLTACGNKRLAHIYVRMLIVGIFSLFPLFEGVNELVIKSLLAVTYSFGCILLLDVNFTNILDYSLLLSILGIFYHYH